MKAQKSLPMHLYTRTECVSLSIRTPGFFCSVFFLETVVEELHKDLVFFVIGRPRRAIGQAKDDVYLLNVWKSLG